MLSILIVNWNTKDLLRICLHSILAFPPHRPFEVIVVDNASSDGSADMVAADFPQVKLVVSEKNTGYARGNNFCFENAHGDLLLTLNPDTEFVDNSLDISIDRLEATPSAGCLGVKQVGLDGKTQRSIRGFPTIAGICGDLLGLGKALGGAFDSYRMVRFDYEREQIAPQPMGTYLLFRRDALVAIGDPKRPFDESFPIFFNEVDLLFRLKRAGWSCLYTPMAQIRHHGGESTKQVRKSMIWESHKSLSRYLWKHYGRSFQIVGLPFVSLLIFAAAFVRAKGYDAGFRA
jgi:N-acetylglucosaminyl-diphospho-decaprenol L-rhamnosyltransferase